MRDKPGRRFPFAAVGLLLVAGATVDFIPTYAGAGTVTVTVRRMQLVHDDDTQTDLWIPVAGTDYSVSFLVTNTAHV